MAPRTALFIGDSITDAARRTDPSGHLGAGYVRRIAEISRDESAGLRVLNAGISGDRAVDLRRRWTEDCLEQAPEILTVMVGINDVWRRYDSNDPTSVETFTDHYQAILEAAVGMPSLERLVIMEPFVVPIDEAQARWYQEDLGAKIEATRSLASRFGARHIALHDIFTEHAVAIGSLSVTDDGVHPSAGGHELIARTWWASVMAGPRTH